MSLASLIAEVEKLTAPSREVDARVCVYLYNAMPGGYATLAHDASVNGTFAWDIDDDSETAGCGLSAAPRYTASIDAVVALIERELPGREWSLSGVSGAYNACMCAEDARILLRPDTERYGKGPNGAIALLLAFLRALEARAG